MEAIGHYLGDVFRPVLRFLGRILSRVVVHPLREVFGPYTWLAAVVLALVAGVIFAALLTRRRTRLARDEIEHLASPPPEDPSDLEAAAVEAERAGDSARAVRLRFRAGLARLEIVGAIPDRNVTTSRQVRQTLKSQAFDHLADAHEAIAYAGLTATAEEASAAKDQWPRVIEDARTMVNAEISAR